jgi:hypothetical protein
MRSYWDRILFEIAESRRLHGLKTKGYVHEVMQEKGEQKVRVVHGIKPDGSPLIGPWMPMDHHSSPGGSRELQNVTKGMPVEMSTQGGDYRQAHVAPGQQSSSAKYPDHADDVNGDTFQGGKLRMSRHQPQEDQGGGSGGGSSAQGGQSGGQQQKKRGEDKHYYSMWIAKDKGKEEKHKDQPNQPLMGAGAGAGGQQGQQQQGQQQQGGKQEKGEAAMVMHVHEEGGVQGRVGNEDNSPRFLATGDGKYVTIAAGKECTFWIDKSEKQTYFFPPPKLKEFPGKFNNKF